MPSADQMRAWKEFELRKWHGYEVRKERMDRDYEVGRGLQEAAEKSAP